MAFRCNVTTAGGEECGRTYNQKANLERHMRSHVNEKAFTCELCGKSFVDSTRLKVLEMLGFTGVNIHVGH